MPIPCLTSKWCRCNIGKCCFFLTDSILLSKIALFLGVVRRFPFLLKKIVFCGVSNSQITDQFLRWDWSPLNQLDSKWLNSILFKMRRYSASEFGND
jgi:hypothetical protein